MFLNLLKVVENLSNALKLRGCERTTELTMKKVSYQYKRLFKYKSQKFGCGTVDTRKNEDYKKIWSVQFVFAAFLKRFGQGPGVRENLLLSSLNKWLRQRKKKSMPRAFYSLSPHVRKNMTFSFWQNWDVMIHFLKKYGSIQYKSWLWWKAS